MICFFFFFFFDQWLKKEVNCFAWLGNREIIFPVYSDKMKPCEFPQSAILANNLILAPIVIHLPRLMVNSKRVKFIGWYRMFQSVKRFWNINENLWYAIVPMKVRGYLITQLNHRIVFTVTSRNTSCVEKEKCTPTQGRRYPWESYLVLPEHI